MAHSASDDNRISWRFSFSRRLARVTKATGIGIFIAGFALSFSSMVYVAFFE
jgi:hypothetical protein